MAVGRALRKGFKSLLFVDSDMVFEPNVVQSMIESAPPESVLGAVCPRQGGKGVNCSPAPIGSELYRVNWIGAGLMLIDLAAAERVGRELPEVIDEHGVPFKPWFLPIIANKQYWSEDYSFCLRCLASEVGVWALPAKVGHVRKGTDLVDWYEPPTA